MSSQPRAETPFHTGEQAVNGPARESLEQGGTLHGHNLCTIILENAPEMRFPRQREPLQIFTHTASRRKGALRCSRVTAAHWRTARVRRYHHDP